MHVVRTTFPTGAPRGCLRRHGMQAAHLSLGGNHRGASCPHLSVCRGSTGCHTALPLCDWSDLGRVQLGGQHERAGCRRQQLGAQRRQQLPQGGQLRLYMRRQTASLQTGTSCQSFLQHPCRRVSPAPLQTGSSCQVGLQNASILKQTGTSSSRACGCQRPHNPS